MNFNERYAEYKAYFEEKLDIAIESFKCENKTLKQAMKYSLTAGGKRIRPVILLACADLLDVDREKAMPYALAIEYIHTYSLIHDDLPAMDNDDFRRGKPTCHKVYGEAMAILAGDALLNLAYETCFRAVSNINSISACRLLALYAGSFGMIGGQATDIETENSLGSEELLLKIHEGKTAKLILASLLVPSCLAENKFFDELSLYGKNFGLLFQVVDDILDASSTKEVVGKSVGKDLSQNKLTFVNLYGLEKATELKNYYLNECLNAVERFGKNSFLAELAIYCAERKN